MSRWLASTWIAACCAPSCTSSAEVSTRSVPARSPAQAVPWTRDFQDPALLVCEEVHISGPDGLLEHFALRVEPGYHTRKEETTANGYLQLIEVQPGVAVEIRGYLDQLEIAAFRRMTVLERPGDVEVSVEARGDVYFARRSTGEERRVPTLSLTGRKPALAEPAVR